MPITPRELEILDVVGEVMQERLKEMRREYGEKVDLLMAKVAALEARPMGLRAFPDDIRVELAPLTEKIAALEARPVVEVPAAIDLTPLEKKLADVEERLLFTPTEASKVQTDVLAAVEERLLTIEERRLELASAGTDALVRVETQAKEGFAQLTAQIEALEARQPEVTRKSLDDLEETVERRLAMLPPPEVTADSLRVFGNELEENFQQRLAALPPPADVNGAIAELNAKIAAELDERLGTVAVDHINLETLHERVRTIEAKPPPDFDAHTEKVETMVANVAQTFALRIGELSEATKLQIAAIPPPPDLTPLTERIATLEARPAPDLAPLSEKVAALEARPADLPKQFDTLGHCAAEHEKDLLAHVERFRALEKRVTDIPNLLTPITEKLAELEQRPTGEDVLKLAQSAVTATSADLLKTLQGELEQRFKALPIPEKGEQGDGVTVEDFRSLFEAEYAKFELETERRIMELVQRTLDRIPVPKSGKDGVGFDDLNIVRDGRTIRHEYLREGEVVKTFEFKTDEMRYQEVYKAGQRYDKGDTVSWGGNIWVALKDTDAAPVLRNGDWKLAVKEGRRGRSAYDIAVDQGFVGSEADWLASLKGAPGKDAKARAPNGTMRGSTEP